MRCKLNHRELLGKLPRVKYEPPPDDRPKRMTHLSLAGSLLAIADIDHDREYQLCRTVATHLLGYLPEATDVGDEE